MNEKRCCKCKEDKPLDTFANSSCRKDGKQDYCRQCMSLVRKEHRQKLKTVDRQIPASKYCPKCQETKPAEEFYTSISKTSGLQDACKKCQNMTSIAYMKAHPIETIAHNKAYRKRNLDKVHNWGRKAKIKRNRLLAGAKCDEDITLEGVYSRDGGICGICGTYCGKNDASIDHIRPLSKRGDHTWDNIQLAHFSCNSSKGNKYAEQRA